MTLSWPDGDSLGLLPSDVCLFDVLSQPVKAPPPILPIKIPCKNDLNEIFDDCSLPSHWGFSIKNPTIESEVSWSSLLSFLHFRRTEFTTVLIIYLLKVSSVSSSPMPSVTVTVLMPFSPFMAWEHSHKYNVNETSTTSQAEETTSDSCAKCHCLLYQTGS